MDRGRDGVREPCFGTFCGAVGVLYVFNPRCFPRRVASVGSSGATSLVLYAAGLLGPTALDSTELESYGQPGGGRWITIYANSTHAWIVIAGIALDTADYGGPPVPAGTGPRWRAEPLANLNDGTNYVVRHPAGL